MLGGWREGGLYGKLGRVGSGGEGLGWRGHKVTVLPGEQGGSRK